MSPSFLRRLALSGVAFAVSLAGVELLFQVRPELLPEAYRRSLPLKGQELIAPQIARNTPVDGVGLPTAMWDYVGPPPADLVEDGLAPPSARDGEPERMVLALDSWGLPNPSVPERADVVLLGDSFVYGMGAQDPPGLAPRLAKATGQATYCVGVTGIGPFQELYLLEELALELKPELVIWFVFGGNDLQGAGATLEHQAAGRESLMDRLWPEGPPRGRLRDLARWVVSGSPKAPAAGQHHPGVSVPGETGDHLTWFHPEYSSSLAVPPEILDNWAAYRGLTDCLFGAAERCAQAECDLWVVYLPSKAECYLPLIPSDQESAFLEQCFHGRPAPERAAWPELVREMRSHVGALGERLGRDCRAKGIRYFDATEILREEMSAGRPPYFAADTHLALQGQKRLLSELLLRLEQPEDAEGSVHAPTHESGNSEG